MDIINVIAIHFYVVYHEFNSNEYEPFIGYFLNYIEAQDFIKENRKAGNVIRVGWMERVDVEKHFFF